MSTFDEMRTANAGAVPNSTDLIVVQKQDGTPGVYTLTEFATFLNGITTPTWQTDSAHGCYLTIAGGSTVTQTDSVIAFDNIDRDTGFYASQGSILIPSGVIRIQIVAQVKATNATPTLKILKDGNNTTPIAVNVGAGGYSIVVSPEITVAAGDTFQIYCAGAGSIYRSAETFFNVRTIEKTA